MIAEGAKGELTASVGAGSVHLRLRDGEQRRPVAAEALRRTLDATVQREPDPVALTARAGTATGGSAAEQAARALGELARSGVTVDNFTLGQPSLDEVFLAAIASVVMLAVGMLLGYRPGGGSRASSPGSPCRSSFRSRSRGSGRCSGGCCAPRSR